MPDAPNRIQFVADRGDARLRLDLAIQRRVLEVSGLSRTRVQGWIDDGRVQVDGAVASRASMHPREGAVVVIDLPHSVRLREAPGPEHRPLDVLYEDETLLAVNKPPGLVVHPSYRNSSGTLLNAVLGRIGGGRIPGIVTRLDKDTSGLVLLAMTPGIHHAIQRDVAAGLVRKEYLALVRGIPSRTESRITLPLARDPADRRRMITTESGAPSETRVRIESVHGDRTLVRCELVTGRTHQIRVHMAAIGHPVAGDAVYGTADPDIPRQALHAWRISLPHPLTRAPLLIEAPLPADIRALIEHR